MPLSGWPSSPPNTPQTQNVASSASVVIGPLTMSTSTPEFALNAVLSAVNAVFASSSAAGLSDSNSMPNFFSPSSVDS